MKIPVIAQLTNILLQSKRRFKHDDDDHKSRRDKDRKETQSDKRRSDDRRVKEKSSRKHEDKKHKSRHRSKSPEKSSRRRSSSNSPVREKKNLLKPIESRFSKPSPSSSSSPQKSPMISLTTPTLKLPPEPKVELPAYYNPNVINVNKFAEQQKKRKMLWSGKKDEPADAAKWGGAKFSQDSDGTKASKFMRLMGIKDGEFINNII